MGLIWDWHGDPDPAQEPSFTLTDNLILGAVLGLVVILALLWGGV